MESSPFSVYRLNRLFLSGLFVIALSCHSVSVAAIDKREASPIDVKLLHSLANTGRAEAQFSLANLYLTGQGVDKNLNTAIMWLNKSATQDYAPAQNLLGLIYLGQHEHPVDCRQAQFWFSRVASDSRLFDQAQSNLAWVLATCPQNDVRNGQHALDIINNLLQSNTRPSASLLDTLAAAYAETGQFEQAQKNQQRAIDQLEQQNADPEQKQRFLARLEHYRQNQPWRLQTQ